MNFKLLTYQVFCTLFLICILPLTAQGIDRTDQNLYLFNKEKDSLILLELYHATNGKNWKRPWNLFKPMNTWHGLYIANDYSGYTLNLSYNGLTGTLPESLRSLTGLTHINLEGNLLNGRISIKGRQPETFEYESFAWGTDLHAINNSESIKKYAEILSQSAGINPHVNYRTLHRITYEDWEGINECFSFDGNIRICFYQSYESRGIFLKMNKSDFNFKKAFHIANVLLDGKLEIYFGPHGNKIPFEESFEDASWPDQRSYAESREVSGSPVYTIATEDCGEWSTFREDGGYYILDMGYGC